MFRCALAARGETAAAFGRRCIPSPPHRAEKRAAGTPASDCVAPRSNIPDILARRALPAGRIAALGATPDFHHGLLAADLAALQSQPAAAAQKSREIYQSVYNGWKWWHVYCYRCHGTNAVGTTLAPDLTDPNGKLSLKEFLRIVQNGIDDGTMQSWAKLLDEKQITQLYIYVRARADKVLPPGRPDEVGPNGGPWLPPRGWPRRR